jgi:hypothetical protein
MPRIRRVAPDGSARHSARAEFLPIGGVARAAALPASPSRIEEHQDLWAGRRFMRPDCRRSPQSEHTTNVPRVIFRTAVGRERSSATRSLRTKLTWFARPKSTLHLTPSQQKERSMAWRTLTDAEIAALIGTRIDVERTGVGIVVSVIDDDGRREVVA